MPGSSIYTPHPALAPFIEKYTVNEIANDHVSRVIPDLSVVMGFQFGGKLSLPGQAGDIPLDRLCLTGIGSRYRLFKNSPGFGIILVYFKPAGASLFFEVPLHSFFQSSISLKAFDRRKDLDETEEKIEAANTHDQRIAVINQFFLRRLKPAGYDLLVAHAAQTIYAQNGDVRINVLARQLGISQSRLEKRFRSTVGCGPKKYSTLVKLRSAMGLIPGQLLTQTSLDSGFYDQSHFIKAFKTFTGMTPTEYRRA